MRETGVNTSLVKSLAIHTGIDVWYTRMEDHNPSSFFTFLSEVEKEKAAKLRDFTKSGYSVISRGILRVLIGRYLGIPPVNVDIEYMPNGKPVLAPVASNKISFNSSHSHGVLVIAISQSYMVGIDIEKIDSRTDPRQAGSLVFSPEEITFIEKSDFFLDDFFKIWSIKEAILKATGDGFAYPSRNFSVISSNNSSILSCLTGPVTSNRKCEIHPFSLFGDYPGALAAIYP